MNVADLQKKLGLEIPTQYQALLLNYPTELRGSIEKGELFSSPERVLAENKAVRATPVDGKEWPDHMLVVGEDGEDNRFVIDNRTEPASIWLYNSSDASFSMVAFSISHWLPWLHDKAKPEREA